MTDRSRTRLDEIVEEALGEPKFKVEDCVSAQEWMLLNEPRVAAEKILTRAVERAFRHGVEQDTLYRQMRDNSTVQPAPAVEKPNPCPGCLNPREWHRTGCPVKDRRKGVRRKVVHIELGDGTYFYPVDSDTYRRSRRSGKDRRVK